MHPFGGTSICPRCEKTVYAAEQTMGPGRMLYHKFCLKCTSCNKRLDSLSLVEHDRQPYCKQCHAKYFGTRDLRQANLPNREDVDLTQSLSAPSSPTRSSNDGNAPYTPSRRSVEATDKFEPDGDLAVSASAYAHTDVDPSNGTKDEPKDVERLETDHVDDSSERSTPNRAWSPASSNSFLQHRTTSPIFPTTTGTRYGAALTGGYNRPLSPLSTGSSWTSTRSTRTGAPAMPGSGTPLCARCAKPVYFAEQVRAVGKTFHKPCLRCTECNTSLDSTRLAEKDGRVVCRSCYGKLYGPQGSGYALLGKAGG